MWLDSLSELCVVAAMIIVVVFIVVICRFCSVLVLNQCLGVLLSSVISH